MALKISLCLVVWNEIAGCRVDVPRLPREGFHEVYAVDGGSNDGTVEYLVEAGIPVHRQPRRSLNAAYHHAVERSTGEAVIVFFPKGTVEPECVRAMANELEKGTALVIASRNLPGAVNEEDSRLLKPRKWGVAMLAAIASMIWKREGARLTDVLHGVKGFSNEAFRRMRVSESGVTIDLEMVVRSYRLRLSRAEIPVAENPRIAGQTHFKIWPTAKKLARFLVTELVAPVPLDPASCRRGNAPGGR